MPILDTTDQNLVLEYFARKGFNATQMVEAHTETTSLPDFVVRKGTSLVFYCDVVSSVREGGVDCTAERVTEAAARLHRVNPLHSMPNVVCVVNWDRYSNIQHLRPAIEGAHIIGNGCGLWSFRRYLMGGTKRPGGEIDMLLWFNGIDPMSQPQICLNAESKHIERISVLIGIDPSDAPDCRPFLDM
jgi:hypothetical protein